jgi:hypothetical protein
MNVLFLLYGWSRSRSREYSSGDPLRWPRDTLYPQKLSLSLSTSGGRSVGIVRSRTKAKEFSFLCGGVQPSPLLLRPLLAYFTSAGWRWWVWVIRWNVWQGEKKYSEKTYRSAALSTINPTWLCPVGSRRVTAWAMARAIQGVSK